MKKVFILLFLIINSLASAKTYYVSTTGNDNNPGVFSQPWATWSKAFKTADAGDTVYFRGGIYYVTTGISCIPKDGLGHTGTRSNPICYFNYPGEVPILDGINKISPSPGIWFWNTSNIHFKGLTVRNNFQLKENYDAASGIAFTVGNNIIIENCTSYNNGKRGFYLLDIDTALIVNCDAYNNCDNLSTGYEGGAGDGFLVWDGGTVQDSISYVVLRNCRAWHNSDDGIDIETEGYIECDNSWAFNNGYLDGDGNGFKYGLKNIQSEGLSRKITNCLAAYNTHKGFDENSGGVAVFMNLEVYNNTSYANGLYGYITYLNGTGKIKSNIYKNNISYKNTAPGEHPIGSGNSHWGYYIHSNNSWDASPSVTVTDADFISVDSTGITGARKADGSLPDLDFLKLASTSDLIDAGTDVGLPYYDGTAPDLGYSEYLSGSFIPPSPVYVSSVIENVTPARLEITYDLTLTSNFVPAPTDFTVQVNLIGRDISTVLISEKKVLLTLSSSIVYGDIVTVAYNKPVDYPLQTALGGKAESLSAQPVTNKCKDPSIPNDPPVVVLKYEASIYSGFVKELDASGSYDPNGDFLTYTWTIPNNIPVSSTTGDKIKFLSPVVTKNEIIEFGLSVYDGKISQSKNFQINVNPYKPELGIAKIEKIEASDYNLNDYPNNVIDGNLNTKWSVNGDNNWILLSLSEPFKISHIQIALLPDQQYASHFDIYASKDNSNWEPVLINTASCSFSGALQTFDFPAAKTNTEYSFVKLIGHGNSLNTWNNYSELKIFGGVGENSPNSIINIGNISIYPNPANEFINVLILEPPSESQLLRIFDCAGAIRFETQLESGVNNVQIPINLNSGVYIAEVLLGKLIMFAQTLIVIR